MMGIRRLIVSNLAHVSVPRLRFPSPTHLNSVTFGRISISKYTTYRHRFS
jgi:hypothetical protein